MMSDDVVGAVWEHVEEKEEDDGLLEGMQGIHYGL